MPMVFIVIRPEPQLPLKEKLPFLKKHRIRRELMSRFLGKKEVEPIISKPLNTSPIGMRNNAYTLIEVLVAVTIFSIFIAGPTGLFITSLRGQRKALATMEIVDTTSYTLEYISRALRMAKKDLNGICLATAKLNYEKTHINQGLKFLNYQGNCQEFFREWDATSTVYRLKEVKAGNENYLTPSDLNIISFDIGPNDSWDQEDDLQPRVTIFFEIQKQNQPETKIRFQTTISQRNLDILY